MLFMIYWATLLVLRIGNNAQARGHVLLLGTIPAFAWREDHGHSVRADALLTEIRTGLLSSKSQNRLKQHAQQCPLLEEYLTHTTFRDFFFSCLRTIGCQFVHTILLPLEYSKGHKSYSKRWYNSMKMSHSWEATSYAAAQKLPRILWNPMVHYRVHKSPTLVRFLSQIDPHTTRSYISKIHFNIIHPPTS
jgi:hypothetical protein